MVLRHAGAAARGSRLKRPNTSVRESARVILGSTQIVVYSPQRGKTQTRPLKEITDLRVATACC